MVPVVGDTFFRDLQFDNTGSLQRQLYQQLHQRIVSGRLSSGMRIPASRALAQNLGVSRNTVSLVLEQLKAEGYLESHVGKGVFVSQQLPPVVDALESDAEVLPLPRLSDYAEVLSSLPLDHGAKDRPFAPGIPDVNAFPMSAWTRIVRRQLDRPHLQTYDCDQGYLPLREALAGYLRASRGVRCDAEQIIITQGAQQAISLCAQVLLNRNDTVLLEEPGYRGARTAFEAHQCRLQPAYVSDNCIDVDQLPKKTAARLLYITPTHHYPLGGILPASDRLRLLQWAAKTDTWILEDDYDSEFHFVGKPIAALQGMASQTPVIYMGSFSKTLLPALRLGFLVVPKSLAAVFSKAKNAMAGESPLLTQAAVAEFIEEGHFVRHLRKMRKHYHSKWLHTLKLLEEDCGDYVEVIAQSAGMHLVIRFDQLDDVALAGEFSNKGYGSTPLSSYTLSSTREAARMRGLVLGFANTTESQRINGIKVLAQLIKKASGAKR